jgi:UDPglucose 6-dehydrogenase
VPTPSNKDGSINLDVLFNCIESIDQTIEDSNPIVLIRSTIVPGTTANLASKFPKLNFVFNPEFLTERSATFDFISQTRYVLGGDFKNTEKVAALYKDRFGDGISLVKTDFNTAELIKYMCNTFFATKVSFLNEMKMICDHVEGDWDKAVEGFVRDGRVGHSHVNVPGHDGKLGFGGSCFPKDIQALLHFGDEHKLDLSVLSGAWKTNLKVRPERDWEDLKGRAVVD